MEYEWAKTFFKYSGNQNYLKIVSTNISDKDKKFIVKYLNKIQYIGEHNLMEYARIFDKDDEKEMKSFLKAFENYKKKDLFSKIESFSNYYYIPKTLKQIQLKKKDITILDCGAYIGDSSLVFSDFFPHGKIIAFEPDMNNFNELKKTILNFNKRNKIIPLKYGLGSETGEGTMAGTGAGAQIALEQVGPISITTIDDIVEKYHYTPDIIKRDIEGCEYASILGAEKTIKKYKPILFISIYHSGKDFFEIKPLLEEWGVGYRFTFTRWNSLHPFADMILVCY